MADLWTGCSSERALPPQERPVPEMLVVFRVGRLLLGIDARRVREIVRAVPLAAPLAGSSGVAGMIVLRGTASAVIELGSLLGTATRDPSSSGRMIAVRSGETTVCLRVDRVEGLREVEEAELEAPPPLLAEVEAPWLDYVTHSADGGLVGVMNLDCVLSRVTLPQREAPAEGG